MSVLKSSFLRLFTTGFVAGAIAVVALHPAETPAAFAPPGATAALR